MRTGGEEGSKGLREIIAGGDVPQESRDDAKEALGTLGRREDVAFLFDQTMHRVEEARRYGPPDYIALAAIANIGGEEACRLLNGSLGEALRAETYQVHFGRYAAIVKKAACLGEPELVDLARRASRDMWADDSLRQSALEYLTESGDARAKATMETLAAMRAAFFDVKVFNEERFPMDLVPRTFRDPEVPWQFKVSLMDVVTTFQKGSKQDLFDLYFDLAALLISERPELRYGKERLASWARKLVRRNGFHRSSWTRTDAVAYLEKKRSRYRRELSAKDFKQMDGVIENVLHWHARSVEEERRLE